MSRFKPYIYIGVEIEDFSLDEKLDKVAERYGGENTGSGFGFGARDRSYNFTDLKAARRFVVHAKKLAKVNNITSDCHLHEDDY